MIKKEIREVWFKDHKATYTKLSDDLKILEWKKPDTLHMNVRYVMDKHNLYVTGDLYSAMYCLTEQANLESLGKYDSYYFNSKMVMMQQDEDVFDSQLAIKELKEQFEEYFGEDIESEVKEVLELLIDIAEECSKKRDWEDAININHLAIGEIDPDYYEWIYQVGMKFSPYAQAYLIGLQMAYAQVFGE